MKTDRNPPAVLPTCGQTTAVIRGPRLTEAEVAALDRDLVALMAVAARPVVTLDLAAVTFLGGTAVGRFAALSRAVRATGGHLRLVNVTPLLRQVFVVCRHGGLLAREQAELSAPVIRALAHRKWQEAGRPSRGGDEFWYAAERELLVVV